MKTDTEMTVSMFKFQPCNEYFAIKNVFESSKGLTDDGRWYGAVKLPEADCFYRTILVGDDARSAHEDAVNNPIVEDALPNPLIRESYNDNYEMPMSPNERTPTRHADGRPTIGENAWEWTQIEGDPDEQSKYAVFTHGDGKLIKIIEIMPTDDDGTFRVRASTYTLIDLDKCDHNAATAIGLSDDMWHDASYNDRAYAMLSYHGGHAEREYNDFDEAIREECREA